MSRNVEKKELVDSLTNLVEVVNKVIVRKSPERNPTENEKIEVSDNELRRLYKPKSKPTTTENATAPFKLTPSDIWGGKRKKKSANKVVQKKKITECLKDVLLIADPRISNVPRKSERNWYYANNLVASAVLLSSEMNEVDIRLEIENRFCSSFNYFEFVFLKAVGEELIEPQIENCDYRTLKHISGQGPIYIRSTKKIEIETERQTDSSESSDEDVRKQKKIQEISNTICQLKKRNYKASSTVTRVKPLVSGSTITKATEKNTILKQDDTRVKPLFSSSTVTKATEEKSILNQDGFGSVRNCETPTSPYCSPISTEDVININENSLPSVLDLTSSKEQKNIHQYFASRPSKINCPICYKDFTADLIADHASGCQDDRQYLIESYEFDPENDTLPYANESEEQNENEQEESDKKLPKSDADKATKLEEILSELQNSQLKETNDRLCCRRPNCWDDFCLHIVKSWTKPERNLFVVFMKELALGSTGPKREFFQVALNQMADSLFLDGEPIPMTMCLEKFFAAGRLMAMSIMQGGPTPNVFTEWCYQMISSHIPLSPKDILPSKKFLENPLIKKITDAANEKEFQAIILDEIEILSRIGYRGVPAKTKLEARDLIIRSIYYKQEVEPKISALRQIEAGLNIRCLLNKIRETPDVFSLCFVKCKNEITANRFLDMTEASFSEDGNIKQQYEVDLNKYFCDYVEYIYYEENSEIKLKDLLRFITGCETVPALGFAKKITINFLHSCNPNCKCYPVASTCGLQLTLPIHISSLEILTECMFEAINGAVIFGRS